MYDILACGVFGAPSALYATTGMPFLSAALIGASNADLSTTQTAMPSALALTAALNARSISPTTGFSDPGHVYEQLTSAQASAAPYCVGTKNGLVVTWLTNANFHLGCLG